MSFVAVAVVGGMAVAGAVAGGMKSGPDANGFGRAQAGDAYNAYKNLVDKGPGAADVTNAYNASTQYGNLLQNTASSGLYDAGAGNRLAEQQFAPQRQALAQALQDQMAQANRAASAAGRSTNDPILRARLGAEQMRATANLSAQQSSAAMQLGRQSTIDNLSLNQQRVGVLQGLADQAFAGQQTLFNMGGQIQAMDMNNAQYEMSRGGGTKGAITGGIMGAGAGMQMMTGFGGMGGGAAAGKAGGGMASGSDGFTMPQMGASAGYGGAPQALSAGSLTSSWAGGMSSAPQYPSMPRNFGPAQSSSSNYSTIPTYLASGYPQQQSSFQTGRWFGN